MAVPLPCPADVVFACVIHSVLGKETERFAAQVLLAVSQAEPLVETAG